MPNNFFQGRMAIGCNLATVTILLFKMLISCHASWTFINECMGPISEFGAHQLPFGTFNLWSSKCIKVVISVCLYREKWNTCLRNQTEIRIRAACTTSSYITSD